MVRTQLFTACCQPPAETPLHAFLPGALSECSWGAGRSVCVPAEDGHVCPARGSGGSLTRACLRSVSEESRDNLVV